MYVSFTIEQKYDQPILLVWLGATRPNWRRSGANLLDSACLGPVLGLRLACHVQIKFKVNGLRIKV